METKKLSRTVRRRLNKKGLFTSIPVTATKQPEQSTSPAIPKQRKRSRKKLKIKDTQSETDKNESKTTISAKATETVAERINKKKKKKKEEKSSKVETKSTKCSLTVADAIEPQSSTTLNGTTFSKRNRKRNPENRVVYINSNYGSSDPNSVGGIIQSELVKLRNQSTEIKTASDLTETQAHVIKRQITRLHAGDQAQTFKRPKHYDKTVGEATKELMLLINAKKSSARL